MFCVKAAENTTAPSIDKTSMFVSPAWKFVALPITPEHDADDSLLFAEAGIAVTKTTPPVPMSEAPMSLRLRFVPGRVLLEVR
jgi:hypothetical protein